MAALSWFGITSWRAQVVQEQRVRVHAGVEALLAEQRWLEARGAVREFLRTQGKSLDAEEVRAWRRLDVLASAGAGDLARLVWLEQQDPALLAQMEAASLKIVRTLSAAGQLEEAERVRARWRGREETPAYWLAADVDRLLARRQIEEARTLLNSTQFEGTADVGRLMRLALLAETPAEAWDQLTAALRADSRHPDVRSFRGQILERAGDVANARTEFVAALVADPADPVRRDQLANFYLRHGAMALALQTWREGLGPAGVDFLWLRVLFWERVAGGTGEPLPVAPVGAWSELIQTLVDLPPTAFWRESVLPATAASRRADLRPEVEILRLLEALKTGDEADARLRAVALSAPAQAMAPVTLNALQAVLRWRATGRRPEFGDLPVAPPGQVEHVLLEQIRAWPAEELPEATARLLSGPDAWSALMLAAGWTESALRLAGDRLSAPVADAPEWFHYGLAVALRQRRDDAAAQAYLQACPPTPGLRLLAAEIRWASGAEDEARAEMATLVTEPESAGFRAAWLLANDAFARREWAEARRWVSARADLAETVGGQEIVARSWASEGDLVTATGLYEALGPRSLEAGLLLARRAFEAGNYRQARELIEALLAGFPDRIELRASLEEVVAAEAAAANEVTP